MYGCVTFKKLITDRQVNFAMQPVEKFLKSKPKLATSLTEQQSKDEEKSIKNI